MTWAKIPALELYRVSQQSLHNRQVLAAAAGRTTFKAGEFWRYVGVALAFPLLRAIWALRHPTPIVAGDAIAIGSRKRSLLKMVARDDFVFDDLQHDLDPQTWRFMTLGIAARYYVQILQFAPFILMLLLRRPKWSAAHFAVTVLEWFYLREIVRQRPHIRTIYCGYYIDRKALSLSLIRQERGIRHIGVQHGAFNMFPFLHRGRCDQVLLMYSFSAPFADHFFSCPSPSDFQVAPDMFDFGWAQRTGKNRFVVFATSADRASTNRAIISALHAALPQDVDILIKPHPRDQLCQYQDLMGGRVEAIDKNLTDAAAYIGGISSVMAEAHNFGIPVFIFSGGGSVDTDFVRHVDPTTYLEQYDLAQAVTKTLAGIPLEAPR